MNEPPPSECPDEHLLMEMLQGMLSDTERDAFDAHLDTCPACTRLVADLAALLCSAEAAPLPPDELRVGRYTVREQVGVGGMGVVYEAWDPTLKRKVALKVLRADLIAPQMRSTYSERLLREAQFLASISHPNILTVYEVLTWNDQVVMAVHFVEGDTLTAWLKATRPGWRAIVQAYMKVGAALSAAHAQGLVHRDVKPANILIEHDGRVWLTDFGLACVIGRDVALIDGDDCASEHSLTQSALTRTGTIVGTPAYMSPEQHLAAETDHRTDQFSLCAALFEALYGVRPFPGTTRRELSLQVCTGSIRTRPTHTDVPKALYRVLARGLSRNPDDRFPSMDALLDALHHAITPKHLGSHTTRILVAAMLALLCGLGAWAWVAPRGTWLPSASTESPTRGAERSQNTHGHNPRIPNHPHDSNTRPTTPAPIHPDPLRDGEQTPATTSHDPSPTTHAQRDISTDQNARREHTTGKTAPSTFQGSRNRAVHSTTPHPNNRDDRPNPPSSTTSRNKTKSSPKAAAHTAHRPKESAKSTTPTTSTPTKGPPSDMAKAESLRQKAMEKRKLHERANTMIARAQRHLSARQGAECLKALEELRTLIASAQIVTPYIAATTMIRTQCMMLAGQCKVGTDMLRI
ncbi:MAG: protein kinase [Myxococcota bacterium]